MDKIKLFRDIENNPVDVRYPDACKLAEMVGFKFKGGKGSHKVYSQEGIIEILNFQNVHGKAKPYQVRQLIKIIEKYNLLEK